MQSQGTEDWFKSRLGKATASRISDVMARGRSGYGASRKNYMAQLLCERLTGNREESYINAAMQRGTDLEPIARGRYEIENDILVIESGLVGHPTIENFAASPDGLVGDDGLVEIKCPNTAQHVEFLRTGIIDGGYQIQMLVQMMCTDRKWCDFVSFDDRLPERLQYKCVRFNFDPKRAGEIATAVTVFLKELDGLIQELETAA